MVHPCVSYCRELLDTFWTGTDGRQVSRQLIDIRVNSAPSSGKILLLLQQIPRGKQPEFTPL